MDVIRMNNIQINRNWDNSMRSTHLAILGGDGGPGSVGFVEPGSGTGTGSDRGPGADG